MRIEKPRERYKMGKIQRDADRKKNREVFGTRLLNYTFYGFPLLPHTHTQYSTAATRYTV